MKTIIIACKTLEMELTKAIEETGISYPVIWVESGLHNIPKKLHSYMSGAIAQAEEEGADRILLCFGFCGNSMVGLSTKHAEMILPAVDDCISLVLGSVEKRRTLEREEGGTYFMTKGWIDGERNLMVEYNYAIEKYGEEDGQEIFDMMFGNYRQIGILDTGCYEMPPVEKEAEYMATTLNLGWKIFPASNQYIKELLTGPWPEDKFVHIAPGTEIQAKIL